MTSIFSEAWISDRVAAELEPFDRRVDSVQKLPELPGSERHFVVGEDKLGFLWSLNIGFVEQPCQRVFVEVTYHEPAAHLGGFVHGGASSAVIDAFAAVCGILRLQWNMTAVTKEQTVRFLRPLRVETTYLLTARSEDDVARSDREARVRCQIVDEAGAVCVESDTLIVVPKRG